MFGNVRAELSDFGKVRPNLAPDSAECEPMLATFGPASTKVRACSVEADQTLLRPDFELVLADSSPMSAELGALKGLEGSAHVSGSRRQSGQSVPLSFGRRSFVDTLDCGAVTDLKGIGSVKDHACLPTPCEQRCPSA